MGLPSKGDTYQCAGCKGTFIASRTHEECVAETETVFGGEFNESKAVVLCDDCWQKIVAWHQKLPAEEKIPWRS